MKSKTLFDSFESAVRGTIRQDLIFYEGTNISSKQLLQDTYAFFDFLADKFGSGEIITFNLPNIPNAITCFYAINRSGNVASILHPQLPIDNVLDAMAFTDSKIFITFYAYYKENQQKLEESGYTIIICNISDYLKGFKKACFSAVFEKNVRSTDKIFTYKEIVFKRDKCLPLPKNPNKSVAADDTAVYLHSGGTTGKPKVIQLTAFCLNSLSLSLETVIDNLDQRHNVCLSVLPFFHGFGLGVCMHTMLTHGFKIALMPKFSPEKAIDYIYKNKVTLVAGIPKMYDKIAQVTSEKNGYKLKTLEYCFSGGDKLPENTKKKFDTIMYACGSTAVLQEGYGLTECASVCSVSGKEEDFPNCVGKPLDDLKMAIVDEDFNFLKPGKTGEILVAGDTLMKDYLKSELSSFITIDDTKWLITGDLGHCDEEGRFYFEGRKKRLIKISGYSVFPSEIEECVQSLPYISESVAIGIGEPVQEIKLFIKLNENKSFDVVKKEIDNLCKNRLIKYARPKTIVMLDEFPRTPVGKIDEKVLYDI